MRKVVVLIALTLAGCEQPVDEDYTAKAQHILDRAVVVCRDGQQFYVYPKTGYHGPAFEHRLNDDGKPMKCSRTPTAYSERPVE